MKVRDAMTPAPASAQPSTGLTDVARLMNEHDCGSIPILEGDKPVGIVTDRDIVCRAVANGRDPTRLTVADVMTEPVTTVFEDDDVGEVCRQMADRQIRRVVVVDVAGRCTGIIGQADIARSVDEGGAGRVLREISAPAAPPT